MTRTDSDHSDAHRTKADPDAPTVAQLTGAVTEQHGMVRTAFRTLQHAGADDREAALHALLQLLALHEAAEQLTVHPAITRMGSERVGRERAAEEKQAVQLIERLQDLEPASFEFHIQLDLLEEAVENHATAEEERELPRFVELTAAERTAIGTALARVVDGVGLERAPLATVAFGRMVDQAKAHLSD